MNQDRKTSVEVPFLDRESRDDSISDFEAGEKSLPNTKKPFLVRHRFGIALHSILIIFYLYVAISFYPSISRCSSSTRSSLYTPVQDHLRYITEVIPDSPHDIATSEYVGKSSPELDEAWYRLLRHHNIRITEQELHALNQTSVPLQHGGGYMGMMGVYHELHCLKLVREAVHPEYYYKGKSEAEKQMLIGHTEHCIDILRAGSMCRADTAIFPYEWKEGTRLPSPVWLQKHTCVDWNKLTEWLEERRIDIYEHNLLVHPKFGPTYPGGQRISEPNGPQVYPLDEE